MADQKKWFKLWHSALSDDALTRLDPALRWAWAALGAHTKVHGTRGCVTISKTNAVLAAEMGVKLEDMIVTISMLPHVHIEEGKIDNGNISVTWSKWIQYQEDSTVAERVSRLRYKRRGEEKRGEEKRKEEKNIKTYCASSASKISKIKTHNQDPMDWKIAIAHVYESLKKHKGVVVPISGKQAKALKSLESHYQACGLMALWDLWMESGKQWDDWAGRTGHSIEGFITTLPKLLDDKTWKTRSKAYNQKIHSQNDNRIDPNGPKGGVG